MIINVTFDSSVNNAPPGFVASFDAVVQYFESQFNNPITINIDVGYGEIGPNNTPLAQGALGESSTEFNSYSYSAIRTALVGNAVSAVQMSAAGTLPGSDPTPGGNGNYWVSTAEAKALGLSGPSSAIDGWVGFANTSSATFTYNTTNGGSVAPGTYDFFGVAAHEISEVLGRELFVGDQDGQGIGANSYTPLDLFHYSSNGVRDFAGTTAGYFSFDAGATDVDQFNTNPSGDFGDWASSAGNDAFLAFSGSGHANLVTQADLNELNVLGYDAAGPALAPGPAGFVGDFNSDGHSDLLWQATDGQPTMWLMNGKTITTAQGLPNSGPSWHVIATGDFNGDGKSDILWQATDGAPDIWEMNGISIIGAALLPNSGPSWHAIATGDFNGDGKSDILWQATDGAPDIWEMNGTSIIGAALLPNSGPSWHVIATGDFNGDGKSDILWQNNDGTVAEWFMNGTQLVSGGSVAFNPGPSWHAIGTGDFNGDGKADILFQNTDGTPAVWLMNGLNILSGANVGFNPGPSWHALTTGDYNGDGKSDILWQNTDGTPAIWLMNGTSVISGANVGSDPGSNWHVIPPHHDLLIGG
jgi:hypothetical protein